MTKWRFWRRSEVAAAEEAARHSLEERSEVEELVKDLRRRAGTNHFAEAIARALRGEP